MKVEVHEARNNSCISNLSDRARFSPNYNSRKFPSRPLVGKKNGTVWAKGKPVVKTVELVAA